MMNNNYSKAYTEVLEIISHFSEEELQKIPQEKINYYKENCDKEYSFKIIPEIDLAEQNISKEANAILVALFRDYYATEKQKETLNSLLRQNQQKAEQEKSEKYNPDDIFKNRKMESNKETENKEELLPMNIEEKWYRKILDFFKNLFKR